MELLVLLLVLAFVLHRFQARDERRRIGLLAGHLGQYQIEKMMETLTEGYMRALGEPDAARQEQIWNLLATTEVALGEQFKRFAARFERVEAPLARVSKLPLSIFYTGQLFPGTTFDLRRALHTHAQGISQAAGKERLGGSAKERAFTLLAELMLMQHTCHWFCKSKTVATARLALRHQTAYDKVLDSVAPGTRQAYCALIAR